MVFGLQNVTKGEKGDDCTPLYMATKYVTMKKVGRVCMMIAHPFI